MHARLFNTFLDRGCLQRPAGLRLAFRESLQVAAERIGRRYQPDAPVRFSDDAAGSRFFPSFQYQRGFVQCSLAANLAPAFLIRRSCSPACDRDAIERCRHRRSRDKGGDAAGICSANHVGGDGDGWMIDDDRLAVFARLPMVQFAPCASFAHPP